MDYFIAGIALGLLFAAIWHLSARLYGEQRPDSRKFKRDEYDSADEFTVHEDAEYMAYSDPILRRQRHSARDENGNAVN